VRYNKFALFKKHVIVVLTFFKKTMANCIKNIDISTTTLLKARDAVQSSNSEIVFAIESERVGVTAKVDKLIKIPGVDSSMNSVDHTDDSLNFIENLNNIGGEGHSHLSHHAFELSSFDKAEIDKRRNETNQYVFALFHKKSNGAVAYKFYNSLGERVNVHVTNDRGESKISGENSAGPAQWSKDFWGIYS